MIHSPNIFPFKICVLLTILNRISFAWITKAYIKYTTRPIVKLFKKKSPKGKHFLKVSVRLLQGPYTISWEYSVSFDIYWFLCCFTNNCKLHSDTWCFVTPLMSYCGNHIRHLLLPLHSIRSIPYQISFSTAQTQFYFLTGSRLISTALGRTLVGIWPDVQTGVSHMDTDNC